MISSNFIRGLVACGCIFPIQQSVAGPLTSAEVTKIINRVAVIDPAKGDHPAEIREVIKDDLGLQTGEKSRSELLFQDNTLTRIGAETFFSFKTGTRDMTLEKGSMLLQVPKGLGGAKIHTAAVTAAITGTTILMEYIPGKYIKVLVLEGSLRLSRKGIFGDSLVLRPGKMVIMPPNAKKIPDPVDVDLKHIVKTSTLVNFPDSPPLPSVALIQAAIDVQAKQLAKNDLVPTNLVLGHGTDVLLASNDQLAKIVEPPGPSGPSGNDGSLAPLPDVAATGTGGTLPESAAPLPVAVPLTASTDPVPTSEPVTVTASTAPLPVIGPVTVSTPTLPVIGPVTVSTPALPVIGPVTVSTGPLPVIGSLTAATAPLPIIGSVLGSAAPLPVIGSLTGTTASLPVIGSLTGTTASLPVIGSLTETTASLPVIGSLTGTTASLPVIGSLTGTTASLPVIGSLTGSIPISPASPINNLLSSNGSVGPAANVLSGLSPASTSPSVSVSSSTQLLGLLSNAVPSAGGTITISPTAISSGGSVAVVPTATTSTDVSNPSATTNSGGVNSALATSPVPVLPPTATSVIGSNPGGVLTTLTSVPTTLAPGTGAPQGSTTRRLSLGRGR